MKTVFISSKTLSKRTMFALATFFLMLTLAGFNSANAIGINGPARVCPNATVTYTVSNLPSGTTRWRYCVDEPTYPYDSYSDWIYPPTDNFTYTFHDIQGTATIKIQAFQNFFKIGEESRPIFISPPNPVKPNNGLVLGCSANQSVQISSLPSLMNNAADCYFHCGYSWAAPSGWTLERSGFSPGNPLLFADHVVFPSGLSNGNVGQITVTALFTECGSLQNTSASSTLWYGPPIISSPNQWLFDSYSNMWQLSHMSQPGFTSSYTVYSGSASLIPNVNDCYVTTADGAVIQLIVSNGCGNSSAYYFTIPAQGGMMMAYPNPAKNTITLQFKGTDSLDQLPEEVKLFSEKSGASVITISVVDYFNRKAFKEGNKIEVDVASLPRGTYYLHVYPNGKSGAELQRIRMMLE